MRARASPSRPPPSASSSSESASPPSASSACQTDAQPSRGEYASHPDFCPGAPARHRLIDASVQALVVPSDALFFSERYRIAELSVQKQLPAIFADRDYVAAGGLMSYGEGISEFYRRAAGYVDKIFKGAKPAELPVEQP